MKRMVTMLLTDEEIGSLRRALERVDEAAEGDSNDEEIEALNDALDWALSLLGVDRREA